jgi:hypothetical protein
MDTDHDGFVELPELTATLPGIEQRLIQQAQAAAAAKPDKAANN